MSVNTDRGRIGRIGNAGVERAHLLARVRACFSRERFQHRSEVANRPGLALVVSQRSAFAGLRHRLSEALVLFPGHLGAECCSDSLRLVDGELVLLGETLAKRVCQVVPDETLCLFVWQCTSVDGKDT